MSDKDVDIIIEKLTNCEIALYQLDQMGIVLLSCLLAGIVIYSIYYMLIRFTWF